MANPTQARPVRHAPQDRAVLAGLQVAYVVQLYPKVSHVFIQREIAGLRRAGAQVDTYSLRRPAPSEVLSEADAAEARRTVSLRPIGPVALARLHLLTFARHRRAYLATLRSAVAASPPGLRARVRQLLYFGQAVVLHDHLRRRPARHVHAHLGNVATDVTWLAVELANGTGGERWTWSFTMHGPTEFHDIARFNLARKVAAADLVVCISDYCRSQLMAVSDPAHWSKLRIVHCGVDVERYSPVDRSERAPHSLLTVGRLVPEKAQTIVLEAIRLLVDRGYDLQGTIVGDGPDRERLHAARDSLGLGDRVELPGALGQDDLVARYEHADAFVMASFDEGVPVVLMEAMASGLPVVATRIAGIPELVDDGVDGLLVAPGRADLLADTLERVLVDAPLRADLGRHARETVTRAFDADTEAVDLGRYLRSCRVRMPS